MSALVTHFGEHAEWTGVMANDRAKWLALRNTMLTASDVAAVLGEDEHKSALEVYVEKITERQPAEEITIDDPRWWGSRLEQPILRAVAEYYGWEFHPGGALLRSKRYPWLGSTLDSEVRRAALEPWIDLEGKTTRIPRGWNEDEGELPTKVLIQVQEQLLVTGASLAIVFALLQGSRPVRIEVHPSAEFHAVIVEESERFIDRVKRADPPAPDHRESSRRALTRLYPTDSGGGVLLPDESVDWTTEIKAITAQVKDLEKRKSELQNMLRAAIGSATYGVLPNEAHTEQIRAWKYALECRPEHTVAASEGRVLRAVKHIPSIPIACNVGPNLARADRAIEDLLRRTLQAEEEAAPIAFRSKRRRSRR